MYIDDRMASRILPRELATLIHHIELNKAGWWDKAVEQLIITAIWRATKPLDIGEIMQIISSDFLINLDEYRVKSQIDILINTNILIEIFNNKYKISEAHQSEINLDFAAAVELEKNVNEKFTNLFKDTNIKLTRVKKAIDWESFNETFLIPYVHEMGAKTYELLIRGNIEIAKSEAFNNYINTFPDEFKSDIRESIRTFLDPKDSDIRTYVIKYLNSHFLVEASNLDENTIEMLKNTSKIKPRFDIYLDTNFILTALELHEDIKNEGVRSLLELVSSLSGKININLYVIKITIDEAKFVLERVRDRTSGMKLTKNLARAASNAPLSSLAQKYFREYSKSDNFIGVETYFNRYIDNLLVLLDRKGIKYNDINLDYYKTSQKVIDDLMGRLDFEEEKYQEKAKGYEQLNHDIILWHFVKDERRSLVESPLEAECWIATLDRRFLGFDSYKRQRINERIPICLHPTTLIQMLQFWVPRTPQYEEAMIKNMRLQLFSKDFSPATEITTMSIIKSLGYYENLTDLPYETITNMLLNDALRQKIKPEQKLDEQIELIREALIEENQKLVNKCEDNQELTMRMSEELETSRDQHRKIFDEFKHAKKELSIKTEKVDGLQKEFNKLSRDLELQKSYSDEVNKNLEETKQDLKEKELKQLEFESKINKLEESLEYERNKNEQDRKLIEKEKIKRNFTIKWIYAPISLLMLSAIGLWQLGSHIDFEIDMTTYLSLLGFFFILWIMLVDKVGSNNKYINEYTLLRTIHQFRYYLCILSSGLLINFLYDLLRSIYG